MTTDPQRWLDDEGSSARAKELLRHARATPMLPVDVQSASAAKLAELGPASGGFAGMGGLKILLGGLFAAGALTFLLWPESGRVEQMPPAETSPELELSVPETQPPVPTEAAFAIPAEAETAAVEPNQDPEGPERERLSEVGPQDRPATLPQQNRTPALVPESAPSAVPNESDALAAEVALLRQAQRALTNDPQTALLLSSRHRREFPQGQLAAPARLIMIEALLRLGRRAAAINQARSMASRYPSEVYRERLISLVGESALQ